MLIDAERNSALREGFRSLGPRCRDLLLMLMHDPPIAYSQISAELNIPVGSIGPSRARCLEKLRRSPVVAALGESSAVEGGTRDQRMVER